MVVVWWPNCWARTARVFDGDDGFVPDKSKRGNLPMWIVSLDLSKLSKAFDRVHWPTLWRALRRSTRPSDGTIE